TTAASSLTDVRLMRAFQRFSSMRSCARRSAAPGGSSCPSSPTPSSIEATSRSVFTCRESPFASSSSVQKMMPEEQHHRLLVDVPVVLALVAVAFIQRVHVPHRLSLLPQRTHHLLRFGYRHARVVL